MESKNKYYDGKYFEWQKKIGEFGGKVESFKFKPFVSNLDTILDFGCGGGYILSNLTCKRKIGIEINSIAKQQALINKIEVYEKIEEVENESIDLIISNHALEHTLNPYDELVALWPKLKKDGKIVFVVPNEKKKKWNPKDINKHLYTWAEINLGNLFEISGYEIVAVDEIYHRWPPFYMFIYNFFGIKLFHFICKIYGYIFRNISQIRVVAIKR